MCVRESDVCVCVCMRESDVCVRKSDVCVCVCERVIQLNSSLFV